jgi:transcriptional regulator with XRE-family HTH domain
MPRPNRNRTIPAEDVLAVRIAAERSARGWTYEDVAEAMTEAGCPIQASAIYKIEKGEPRRRITVNELAALSAVWMIPMERLVSE